MLWKSILIFSNGTFGLTTIDAMLDSLHRPLAPNEIVTQEGISLRHKTTIMREDGPYPVYIEKSSKSQELFAYNMAKKGLQNAGFKL